MEMAAANSIIFNRVSHSFANKSGTGPPTPSPVRGIASNMRSHATPAAAGDASRSSSAAVPDTLYRLGGPLIELSYFPLLIRLLLIDAVSAIIAN